MTSAPSWANIDATIDLPDPIPPVRPRTFTSDRTITRDDADQVDCRAGRLARRHRLLLHPGAPTLSDLAPGSHREPDRPRSEEHTSELQSQSNLVCRLLLEKKKKHNLTVLSLHHYVIIHRS